jgi:hypothetical protein
MPNWTDNIITIKHADKALIDAIEATNDTDKGVLATIIPCPEELNDDDLTTWSRGPEQAARDRKKAAVKAKYGYESWYEWNIAHWGTKWDLCQPVISRIDDNTVVINCQTAWSPPVAAFETMVSRGYEIRALYCGEGPEYAGIWDNGRDDYYNTTNGSKAARTILPQELDDAFDIVMAIEEYEAEDNEELTEWIKEGAEAKAKLEEAGGPAAMHEE